MMSCPSKAALKSLDGESSRDRITGSAEASLMSASCSGVRIIDLTACVGPRRRARRRETYQYFQVITIMMSRRVLICTNVSMPADDSYFLGHV
jgi:hypothetical protein